MVVRVVYGTSEGILDQAIPYYQANPNDTFGPLLIGAAMDSFFLGVLGCQVWNYYSLFPKDQIWNKRLVGICVFLSVAKTIESFFIIWDKNVLGFGDWTYAVSVIWPVSTEPATMILLATAAQSFFAWRCFILTGRNWWILVFMGTAMMGMVGLGMALSIQLAYDPTYWPTMLGLATTMLSLGFVLDTTITSIVLVKLSRSRHGKNRQSKAFFNRWIAITCQCALPPVISQMANLIAYATMHRVSAWSALLNMLTPRLYTFSLMYTLNSRANVNSAEDIEEASSSRSDAPEISMGRQAYERSTAVTLSNFIARGRLVSSTNTNGFLHDI